MRIFIPTLGRAEQVTFWNLPPEIQKQVELVIGDGTYTDAEINCMCVRVPPPSIRGIAATRQWIAEQCDGPFVMLDDDLTFCRRREDDPTKFRPANDSDIIDMFGAIKSYLEVYAHVGVSTREGGNRDISPVAENTRLLRILAYDARVLRGQGIRFDRLPVMEDFDVCLQLLRSGYSNRKINWIAHDQKASNAAGGCSTYRTMQVQAEAAHGLKSLHPDFVTVVTKQTKTAWGGQERTDVRIAWKQAFSEGASGLLDPRKGNDTDPEARGES